MTITISIEHYIWYGEKDPHSYYLEIEILNRQFDTKIPKQIYRVLRRLFFALLKALYYVKYRKHYKDYIDFELDVYYGQIYEAEWHTSQIKWYDNLLGHKEELIFRI